MKFIRNTGITILVLVVAYLLLRQLNLLPDIRHWFRSKPLLIENTPVLIENIRDLNELTTIASFDEVVISKTMENDGTYLGNLIRNRSLQPGIKKITLIAKGRIFAGVDLKLLKENAIQVQKDSVSVQLPKATILDAVVNPSDCEIFIEEGNWATVEVNKLKASARQKIIDRAMERKILEKADQKAKAVMESFLRSVGFKKVNIHS